MSLLVVILVIQNRCVYDLEKVCNRDTSSTAHFVEKVLLEHSDAICTQTVCIHFEGTTDWEGHKACNADQFVVYRKESTNP